jgi:hypothetical protein
MPQQTNPAPLAGGNRAGIGDAGRRSNTTNWRETLARLGITVAKKAEPYPPLLAGALPHGRPRKGGAMSRERLLNRRPSVPETVILTSGERVHVTLGFAVDGRVLETFLRGGKVGSDRDHGLDDIAILVSRLLQHGDTLGDIAAGISRLPDNSPASAIGAVVDTLVAIEAEINGGGP